VAVATDGHAELEGFHTVELDADSLPRDAQAYASIDALIVDSQTLAALDEPQLRALLAHAAQCGRVVLLNADARVRRAIAGAGGCAGRALLRASSITEATQKLDASLAASLPAPLSIADAKRFDRSGESAWRRVVVLVAAYFAAAALAIAFAPSLPVLLLIPGLAAVGFFVVLHGVEPSPRLVVWSESESGAQVARYVAWEWVPGLVRGHTRVPVPTALASTRPCNPNQPMRLDFDPARGRAAFAEFDTRLFGQTALCFSGTFPVDRAIRVDARPDGSLEIRNTGARSWRRGSLLAGRLVSDLPALQPGAKAIASANAGRPADTRLTRAAMARSAPTGRAALWQLDLDSTAGLPADSTGWLLVSIGGP
jgi:hypothetical protein